MCPSRSDSSPEPGDALDQDVRRGGLVCRLTPFVLFLAVCICGAEEPIRVNVRLVNVAFSARDSSGALVDNLTKDDVEVFEDAVPQKVSFFARSVDVPL